MSAPDEPWIGQFWTRDTTGHVYVIMDVDHGRKAAGLDWIHLLDKDAGPFGSATARLTTDQLYAEWTYAGRLLTKPPCPVPGCGRPAYDARRDEEPLERLALIYDDRRIPSLGTFTLICALGHEWTARRFDDAAGGFAIQIEIEKVDDQ